MLELRDGVNTRLVWAVPELKVGRDVNGRDVLLLTGPEPDMAWHRFAATIADLAERFAVARMAALGAYPFAAPHTRPPHLSVTSPSAEVDRRPAVPHELGRRAGRDGRRPRALGVEPGDPGPRHLVAGAALRRHDVVPGGIGGPARGAADGDRDRRRRRRAASRGGPPARAPRPARRRQRRAPGDGRPVRAALRRQRTARASRSRSVGSSCAAATRSPARSSASCATRARAEPPAHRLPSAA